jgi:hypothetical protein
MFSKLDNKIYANNICSCIICVNAQVREKDESKFCLRSGVEKGVHKGQELRTHCNTSKSQMLLRIWHMPGKG